MKLTAKQKRLMKLEAEKEAAWGKTTGIGIDDLTAQGDAIRRAMQPASPRGRKRSGSSRGGKIAMPAANGGGYDYRLVRLHRVA